MSRAGSPAASSAAPASSSWTTTSASRTRFRGCFVSKGTRSGRRSRPTRGCAWPDAPSPRRDSRPAHAAHERPAVPAGHPGAIPELTSTPVAIVTGDYYLDEARRQRSALGAELRFKPLWLEELVTLARELLAPRARLTRRAHSRFLRACRREPVDATPVWFMRQAGRYMAEYRALRERYSLLDICRTPELATEVTLQPVRRIEVDAAILFSDLLLPLEPMGLPFDFIKGEGPQIERPIEPRPTSTGSAFEPREALARARGHPARAARAGGRVPLIGFAGAPFTLASYAIEGGHSNNFAKTKALMYGHPDAWHRLCEQAGRRRRRLPARADRRRRGRGAGVRLVGRHAERRRLREFALPHTRRIFDALGDACRRSTSAPARRPCWRSCATPAAT
jgi:hypothetical protein